MKVKRFFLFAFCLFTFDLALAQAPAPTKLSWTDTSNNETGFVIERNDNAAGYKMIGQTATNVATFSDANISVPATGKNTYCYRVASANSAGKSAFSNEVCRDILAVAVVTIPAAPTNLQDATAAARKAPAAKKK